MKEEREGDEDKFDGNVITEGEYVTDHFLTNWLGRRVEGGAGLGGHSFLGLENEKLILV